MPSVGSGSRIPPGGAADQVLRKKSPTDFDLKWDDASALAGPAGPAGATGATGPKGDTGSTGPAGTQGVKGDTGATGATGPKGDTGSTGPAGPTGPQGIQGVKGDTGATGATGATGPAGAAGSSGGQLTIVSKTAAYTASVGELVLANTTSSSFAITLPASPATGATVAVKNSGTEPTAYATVQPNTGQTIDNGGAAPRLYPGSTQTLQYDGSAWRTTSMSLPSAGSTGQVLTKISGPDSAAYWATPASGSSLTVTPTKTAAYTAAVNDFVQASTSGGTFAITLPSSPADNAVVAIHKIDGSTNALTISGPTEAGSSLQLLYQYQTVTLQYSATATVWRIRDTAATTAAGNPAMGLPAGGTSGQVLTKNASTDFAAAWATPASGSGLAVTTPKTSAYTAVANNLVTVDASTAPVTITLPASAANSTLVGVKRLDSSANTVTIAGNGASIEDQSSITLNFQFAYVLFQYDSFNGSWRVTGQGSNKLDAPYATVPTGGTSGQVLTKSSSTNYAAAWATPSAGAVGNGSALMPWVSGRTYTKPTVNAMGTNSVQIAVSSTAFYPVWIPNACTVSQIRLAVTTGAASSTGWMGLWADAGGTPGARLAYGSFAPTTAQIYAVATNYTFTQPTLVWASLSVSTTSVVFRVSTPATQILNWVLDPNNATGASLTNLRQNTSFGGTTGGNAPTDMTGISTIGAAGLSEPLFQFPLA